MRGCEPSLSRLSVIVPCLDEENCLRVLLPLLAGAVCELIVVDGGSRDASREVAGGFPGVRVIDGAPPRAAQMNLGASRARGDVLLFLHADTVPPPGFEGAIDAALSDPQAAGGAFSLEIDAPGLAPRLVGRAATLRSRLTRSPYGDQGIFVRRAVFDEMGGFAAWPFMEDLEFTHRLRRRGRVRLLAQHVRVSARRWERHGYARTTLRNAVLAGCFYTGIDPGRFAHWVTPVRVPGEASRRDTRAPGAR